MSIPINYGGPAFPVTYPNGDMDYGITLRDYFAGQALAGLTARSESVYRKLASSDETMSSIEEALTSTLAGVAFRYADAMLAARKEESK